MPTPVEGLLRIRRWWWCHRRRRPPQSEGGRRRGGILRQHRDMMEDTATGSHLLVLVAEGKKERVAMMLAGKKSRRATEGVLGGRRGCRGLWIWVLEEEDGQRENEAMADQSEQRVLEQLEQNPDGGGPAKHTGRVEEKGGLRESSVAKSRVRLGSRGSMTTSQCSKSHPLRRIVSLGGRLLQFGDESLRDDIVGWVEKHRTLPTQPPTK